MVAEELMKPVANVLEAVYPFQPDDGHKGSFLIMRIAGMEQGTALRIVNRKYRSLQNWRSTDPYFKNLDDNMPVLASRFGGEARVVRTALLDIQIIETGISVFRRILNKQPVSSDMWAYAMKMAGIRMPMMNATNESESPWEKLANAIKNTSQRELTLTEDVYGTRSITARELTVQPSPEQQRVASEIVRNIISQAAGG